MRPGSNLKQALSERKRVRVIPNMKAKHDQAIPKMIARRRRTEPQAAQNLVESPGCKPINHKVIRPAKGIRPQQRHWPSPLKKARLSAIPTVLLNDLSGHSVILIKPSGSAKAPPSRGLVGRLCLDWLLCPSVAAGVYNKRHRPVGSASRRLQARRHLRGRLVC